MENKEVRKDIIGYEGLYKISNFGNVKSFHNNKWGISEQGKLLTGGRTNGYEYVRLVKDGKRQFCYKHILVSKTFLPNPENKKTVNHKNGIHNDNNIDNLEWMTYSENCLHAFTSLGRKRTNNRDKRKTNILLSKQTICLVNM